MITLESIKVDELAGAIFSLTSMVPYEMVSEDKYELKIGTINPLSLGFKEKVGIMTIDEMRFSSYIQMLEQIVQMMKDESSFLIWKWENNQMSNN